MREGAARRDGAPAHQPPARLPDLRPGRRVQAAGLRVRVRRRARRARASRAGPRRSRSTSGRRSCSTRSAASCAGAACASAARCRRPASSACSTAATSRCSSCSPARELDNPYSMNVADICPVGALTTRDFRFKVRVWFTDDVESVCNQCSRGCNIFVSRSNNKIYRYVPRRNDAVNDTWMCDHGRMSYKKNAARPARPTPRVDGRAASYTDAVKRAAELRARARATRSGKIVGVASPFASNEDLAAFRDLLARLGAGPARFSVPRGESDDILIEAEKAPNAAGCRALGMIESNRPARPRRARHRARPHDARPRCSATSRNIVLIDTHESALSLRADGRAAGAHVPREGRARSRTRAGTCSAFNAVVEPAFEAWSEARGARADRRRRGNLARWRRSTIWVSIFLFALVLLAFAPVMTWVERKQSALMQDRIGANRASILGFKALGLIHPLADVIKMITKEDTIPTGAHRFLHLVSPFIAVAPAIISFAVIPYGGTYEMWGAHVLADRGRSRLRRAVRVRDRLDRDLRLDARRLGRQQQLRNARLDPRVGADDLVRGRARHHRRRPVHDLRHAPAHRHGRDAAGDVPACSASSSTSAGSRRARAWIDWITHPDVGDRPAAARRSSCS